jgi:hypothetical protein
MGKVSGIGWRECLARLLAFNRVEETSYVASV